MNKQKRFLAALNAAKNALDEAGIPFHLHSGTALGAHREKKFIKHDEDIDLGVFVEDWNRNLISKMKKWGFESKYANDKHFGTIKKGKEYTFFYKNGVPLDIFLVYSGKHDNKNINWVASYLGACNKKPGKMCKWQVRAYKPILINFMGKQFYTVPKKTLADMYGKDWHIPKVFDYDTGVERGDYKGLM